MNEMQAHGLLIPVGSKPFEVWIDKNNSLAELQDLVNGNVDVLRVLGNGVDLWVNDEGLFNGSQPNRAIYATKHMEEVGYLDQLTFGHPVNEVPRRGRYRSQGEFASARPGRGQP